MPSSAQVDDNTVGEPEGSKSVSDDQHGVLIYTRICREERQLNLDDGNGVHCMSASNSACATFAETDATNLPSLNIFSNGFDCRLDINLRDQPELAPDDIDKVFVIEYLEACLNTPSNAFWAVINSHWLKGEGPFHANDDFLFMFRILVK